MGGKKENLRVLKDMFADKLDCLKDNRHEMTQTSAESAPDA
jgi:hypothetical protein